MKKLNDEVKNIKKKIKSRLMTDKDFKKIIKEYEPKEIIRKHCNSEITLSSKQLDKVLDLKNKLENQKRGRKENEKDMDKK